jgi:hypothetical protein
VAADGQQRLEQRDRSDEVKSTYGDKRTSPDGRDRSIQASRVRGGCREQENRSHRLVMPVLVCCSLVSLSAQ